MMTMVMMMMILMMMVVVVGVVVVMNIFPWRNSAYDSGLHRAISKPVLSLNRGAKLVLNVGVFHVHDAMSAINVGTLLGPTS